MEWGTGHEQFETHATLCFACVLRPTSAKLFQEFSPWFIVVRKALPNFVSQIQFGQDSRTYSIVPMQIMATPTVSTGVNLTLICSVLAGLPKITRGTVAAEVVHLIMTGPWMWIIQYWHDLNINSPNSLLYIAYNLSSENLVLNQTIRYPLDDLFLYSHHLSVCLTM